MSILSFSFELATALFESQNPFPVDFDDAYQWLGYTRKDNAKRSFLGFKFIENIDYIVSLSNEENSKPAQEGRPGDKLLLTTDCFKTWGMMAQTEEGKQIRLYFLECERVAKEKIRLKSPSELLLEQCQRLVDIERIQKLQDARIRATETKVESHSDRIAGIEAEVGRYSNGHGQYFTIIAYSKIINVIISRVDANRLGRQASKLCRNHNITIQKVKDIQYAYIGAYPEDILQQLPWHEFQR